MIISPIHRLPRIFFTVFMSAAIVWFVSGQKASAGIIDRTFADNGQFTTAFTGYYGNSHPSVTGAKLHKQPGGRTIAIISFFGAGFPFGINSIGIVAIKPDGTVDTTFGTGGKIFITYAQGTYSYAYAGSLMLPDGSFLLHQVVSAVKLPTETRLKKYTANGILDTSFVADIPIGGGPFDRVVWPMAVDPDGKIYVLSYLSYTSGFFVVRLHPNGSRDTSFGTNGMITLGTERSRNNNSGVIGMTLTDTGRLVLGFATGSAIRFNINGSIDRSFGVQGVATVPRPDARSMTYRQMLAQPDGKLLFVGSIGPPAYSALFRFNSRGRPDTSFGTIGLSVSSIFDGGDMPIAASLDPFGNIMVTGRAGFYGISANNMFLARYSPSGNREQFTRVPFRGFRDSAGTDLFVQDDGKIMAAASVGPNPALISPSTELRIVRFSEIKFGEGAISRLYDFDGDGRTDISSYRVDPTNVEESIWDIRTSRGELIYTYFGLNGDIPVPSDFNDDGKTDVAVYRPSTRTWYYKTDIEANVYVSVQFGEDGDIPFANDYDGDRLADLALYSPNSGTWKIKRSSDNQHSIYQFGQPGDEPFTGDFDCDSKADVTVWRPSNATFYVLRSSDGATFSYQIGTSLDQPVSGDFDNDGCSDLAVYDRTTGNWQYRKSSTGQAEFFDWGAPGDLPASGDYNGDGLFDVAVFRPTNTTWYGYYTPFTGFEISFGQAGDIPIPGR